MAYIGQGLSEGFRQSYSYIAQLNQEIFTASYVAGQVDVYVNGVHQYPTNYTATNGANVTITGLTTGDEVVIVAQNMFSVADTVSASQGGAYSNNVTFGDNVKATFGDSADLEIYHDSSNSYIKDSGTGGLRLLADADTAIRSADNSTNKAIFGGDVKLYYLGDLRLATSAAGINVTGTVTANELSINSGTTSSNISIRNSGTPFLNIYSDINGVAILDVDAGDTAGGARFQIDVGGLQALRIVDGNDLYLYNADATPVAKLMWDASGEVLGIGNTSPSASYSIDAAKGIRSSGTAPNFTLQETDAGNQTWLMASYAGNFAVRDTTVAGTAYPLQIEPATPSNTLYLDSTGNVGIGTEPGRRLHVFFSNSTAYNSSSFETNSLGSYIRNSDTTVGSYVGMQFAVGNNSDAAIAAVRTADANAALTFGTRGTGSGAIIERMRIDSSGNVGIGTDTPSATLEIKPPGADGSFRVTSDANFGNNVVISQGYNSYITASNNLYMGVGGTANNLNIVDGNLLVNCTALPTGSAAGFGFTADQLYTATTTTSANTQVRFYNGNGLVGNITTEGSATAYNTSSDQRLKENITDANDAGDKIDAIKVRQYDWKADGSHQDYGMVAQELMTVAPEAVSGDPESEQMMGVDYSKLVPMLIKEIQSLRNRVAQLEGAN